MSTHASSPPRLAAMGVIGCAALLYLAALDTAPAHVAPDEAVFGIHAHAIADTGRDLNGRHLPLFVLVTDPLVPDEHSVAWWQPMLFYLAAGMFRLAPVAAWSLRAPIAALAVVNVALMYLVGRRLFANPWLAVLAAALLALNPAHLILGRMATDYNCPITFALLWLWCLSRYIATDEQWLPPVMGLVLGAGVYSYITSWVVMPFYLALTLAVLYVAGKPRRAMATLCCGFLAPLLLVLVWLWFYPEMPLDVFRNYRVVTDIKVFERVAIYWDYFSPSYLFFSGGSNWLWTTRQAGVFLLAFAVLLPCGIWRICRRPPSAIHAALIVAFAFVPAPIVAALPESPRFATARAILAVPFGVLIGIAGLESLLSQRRRYRVIAVVLLLALPVQFIPFARDYFTAYQVRALREFDYLNMRDTVSYIVSAAATAPMPRLLLYQNLGRRNATQLRFYLATNNRDDLWQHASYFDGRDLSTSAVPAGSLLVINSDHPDVNRLLGSGRFWLEHIVNDDAGAPAAAILRSN